MKPNSISSKQLKLVALVSLIPIVFSLIVFGSWLSNRNQVEPEWLGNPLREDGHRDRALNVWDLQAFDGKIFLAGGSTVNNSGPIKVWAYDPQVQEFDREYVVEEEAIEHFRVLEDRLYIPAADPTKGDRHKFYRREAGKWQRYDSSQVKLAHVRDLIQTDTGEILMVGNTRQVDKPETRGAAIAFEDDNGLKIEPAGIENVLIKGRVSANFNWFFSVFRYQNRIFATNTLLKDAENIEGAIAEYNPESKSFTLNFQLGNDEFIPAEIIGSETMQGRKTIYRPWNPVQFQDYLVYPVRSYSIFSSNYKQAYMNTIGFFYKSGMGNTPQTLELPEGVGEDVLIVDDELYVLANRRDANGKFTIFVFKTDSLNKSTRWQRVAKFDNWSKARSFEYLDGTFYFGLGQDYDAGIYNSGDILSYRPKSGRKKLDRAE